MARRCVSATQLLYVTPRQTLSLGGLYQTDPRKKLTRKPALAKGTVANTHAVIEVSSRSYLLL